MDALRSMAKRALPEGAIEWYRRRRALRRYLRSLSYEIYDRQTKLRVEDLEGAVLARRPDLTERLMKDLLERTDLLLQQLHRQLEGVRARQGAEIRDLTDEVAALRAAVQDLQGKLQPVASGKVRVEEPAPAGPVTD